MKTREELLVDPKEIHYGEDFFDKLQSDENLLSTSGGRILVASRSAAGRVSREEMERN